MDDQIRMVLGNETTCNQVIITWLDSELSNNIRTLSRLHVRAVRDHRRLLPELIEIELSHRLGVCDQPVTEPNSRARRGSEVKSRQRAPLGAFPVESVDVHHYASAKDPAQRGVMPHPNVHEEEHIVSAKS